MKTFNELKPGYDFLLEENVTYQNVSKNNPFTINSLGNVNVFEWAKKYRDSLNNLLLEKGALLLRGFKIEGAENFNKLFSIISGEAIEYKNRTSPRDRVYSNVYTSTSHPNDQTIHMHTENSYSNEYNRIIAFYSLVPAPEGGETPIADERKLMANLKEETLKKFKEKGVLYTRNSMPGIGLNWETIYQTTDKNEVNKTLENLGYDYTWVDDDHLRVTWKLKAIHKHPITGKDMWFNHMFFGINSHYDPAVIEFLGEENLPFVTYYGDGTKIEPEVIKEFVNYYKENSIVFKWKQDDFLLLDNMMFSHGRRPFEGERTTLTAMGEVYQMKT